MIVIVKHACNILQISGLLVCLGAFVKFSSDWGDIKKLLDFGLLKGDQYQDWHYA